MLKFPAKDFHFKVYTELLVTVHIRASANKTWNYSDSACSVNSIEVYENKDGKLTQTIVPDENSFYISNAAPLTIEDMNFDTYDDISIEHFTGVPNENDYCWLYDPKKQQFIRDTILEQASPTEFDHKNMLVISDWTASAGSAGITTYKYINNRLTKIKDVAETAVHDEKTGKEYFDVITRVRTDGKMKTISKKRYEQWHELE